MISFLNAALFAGFLAVAIPPIVHLLSRKRHDEVDWAAMQFLQVSKKTRRKVFLEHFLLMLLRMAIISLVVLAVSSPTIASQWLNRWLGHAKSGERDIVLLIDGSMSMGYSHGGRTAADAAKAWANELINSLNPGDRLAIYHARQSAVPVLPTLSPDFAQARNALQLLTPPRGGVDWPACVQTAFVLLESARKQREVIILTDAQRYGWADEGTLAKWELVGGAAASQPRTWVVNVASDRPPDPVNRSLDAITSVRGVVAAGREVKFKSSVRFSGTGDKSDPGKIKLEIDGRPAGDATTSGSPSDGVMPIEFTHKFTTGSHLVSLRMEPDALPGDNRQDFAIEVLPSIPVLLIDGGTLGGPRRGDFLRDALAPAKDPTPSFFVRAVSVAEFVPTVLYADVKGPGTAPRVVVIANVQQLGKTQNEAIEKFLAEGGSVFVLLGDRCDAKTWNRVSFRAGQGWLPAMMMDVVGNDAADVKLDDAPKLQPASFTHPAMEIFKEPLPGGIQTAYFPKRWKVDVRAAVNDSAAGTAIASLTKGEPWLVERGVGRGRCLLCVVPLDNSWRTNLHTLPDFVRFAHEMSYYLAGAKAAENNLSPAQPIVFDPRTNEPPSGVTVQPPEGAAKLLQPKTWPVIFDATRDPGAYKLTTVGGRVHYYAVRSDPQESVLTPCSPEDQKKVCDVVKKMKWIENPSEIESSDTNDDGPPTREVWWLPMLLALAFLLCEVWYTRSLARRGNPLE
jgi:von Willebrand factor type A domain/Aerotolerance regulator N-terminal